jgi:hypothetical protein
MRPPAGEFYVDGHRRLFDRPACRPDSPIAIQRSSKAGAPYGYAATHGATDQLKAADHREQRHNRCQQRWDSGRTAHDRPEFRGHDDDSCEQGGDADGPEQQTGCGANRSLRHMTREA